MVKIISVSRNFLGTIRMSDLSDIRKSHNLKLQSNKMILFLATKDCLPLCGAAVEAQLPFGGVRFLKIKYKIGFRDVSNSPNQMVSWIVLYKMKIFFMVKRSSLPFDTYGGSQLLL